MSMYVNDRSAASRQFVANPPFWGSKMASLTTSSYQNNPVRSHLVYVAGILAFSAVLGGLYLGVQSYFAGRDSDRHVAEIVGRAFPLVGLVVLFGGVGAWYWWSRRRRIVIAVTSDGLTVNTRPRDVYSLSDAKLGTWGVTGGMAMGTTLHLQCGSRRFVLGGQDHRLAAGTRLEAPDAGYGLPVDIDAWLSAPEFDELLTIVGPRSGLDVRKPAPGGPTRCLLFPNPMLIQQTGSWAFGEQRRVAQSQNQPRLAIDLGADTIRVIDPNSNALIASTSPAQVTAAPVTYGSTHRHLIPNLGHVLSDAAATYWSTTPGLHVSIPGMPPLTIGCRDSISGLRHRFSWPGLPTQDAHADYVVSGADWLTLVEKFGLAAYLKQDGKAGATPV